jgi:hypothetical protein
VGPTGALPVDCESAVTEGKVQLTETHFLSILLPHSTLPSPIYLSAGELTSTLKAFPKITEKSKNFCRAPV